MNLFKINEYVLILYDLYYLKAEIESIRELRNYIKLFNLDWNECKIKQSLFLFLKLILTDGSHSIQNHKNEVYEKSKNNVEDFLEKYSDIYDQMVKLINDGAETNNSTEYNKLIDLDYYLHWTKAWSNELCQLSKLGIRKPISENCKTDLSYQYQMPNPPFIPDNDCGCEE